MADEKDERGTQVGPFELGAGHEVGRGLGRLYEARHLDTGKPVLILLPDQEVLWPFQQPWGMTVSSLVHPAALVLEVNHAPASVPMSGLANMTVLAWSAVEKVEDNPQVQAHLAQGFVSSPPLGSRQARPEWRSRHVVALAAMALLTVAAGLWLSFSDDTRSARPPDFTSDSQTDASGVFHANAPQGHVVAYPMPSGPFRNQERAPCRTKGETVVNGGCWMELAQKPPCGEFQAEHMGKCFMPMIKVRDETPPASQKP